MTYLYKICSCKAADCRLIDKSAVVSLEKLVDYLLLCLAKKCQISLVALSLFVGLPTMR